MKRIVLLFILSFFFASALAQGRSANTEGAYLPLFGYHEGKLLVARPDMPDSRFRQSVVLLMRHNERGALGLILNRVARKISLSKLYARFGIRASQDMGEVDIHYGGPVSPNSGFVIHTTEHKIDAVYEMGENLAISPMDVVLKAIAAGRRPDKMIFAVGYAGWGAGQLWGEMRRGDWYTAPADQDILFDDDQSSKWHRAMERRFRLM